MEIQSEELTIGQGLITRLAGPSVIGRTENARENDRTSGVTGRVVIPKGPSREPLPLFMDTLYKAREFDPL